MPKVIIINHCNLCSYGFPSIEGSLNCTAPLTKVKEYIYQMVSEQQPRFANSIADARKYPIPKGCPLKEVKDA